MDNIETLSNKDSFVRMYIIICGLVLLLLVNGIIFIYIKINYIPLWYIVLIMIFAYLFISIVNLTNNLKYIVSSKGIEIKLSKKRNYTLLFNDIKKIEKLDKIPFWRGFGIKYSMINKEVYFTTAVTKLIKIVMKDGRNIIISPKSIDESILKTYN